MIDKQLLDAIIDVSINKEDKRMLLNHAFFQKGYLYASDGYVMLRISERRLSEATKKDYCSQDAPNISRVLINKDDFDRKGIITLGMVDNIVKRFPLETTYGTKEIKCPECDGEGLITVTYEAEFDNEDYDFEESCPICDGSGTIIVDDEENLVQTPDEYYPIKIYTVFVTSRIIMWLQTIMKAAHLNKVIVRYADSVSKKIVVTTEIGIELYIMGLLTPDEKAPAYKEPMILIQEDMD